MQKKRRRLVVIVAIIMAALMILPIIIQGIAHLIPEAEGAVTQSEINARKRALENLRANKRKTQGEINSLRGRQSNIADRKRLYEEQISQVEQEIELTTKLIADLNLAIAGQQLELDKAREQEAELAELYIARVVAMEDMGEISYLGVLLRADSLTDFVSRWDAVREIMARDQRLTEELLAKRQVIEEEIEKIDADRKELVEERYKLTESQEELASLVVEIDAIMAEYITEMAKLQADADKLAADEAAAEREIKSMEAEWARIQAELRRREEERRRQQQSNNFVGGAYRWPVPGHTNITSPFGMRLHPIFRVNRMHNGIDISAPRGTPVVAANAGEIIVRTYGSGYGNYIAIDHGGNQVSIYAHLNGFNNAFKVGSTVKSGDVIGYVGSTGVSTGYHLHFEIKVNGKFQDPRPLLTGR
jgi:murein DD-endopeptidase MepM/ murein hydrolase activator NlpD